jgi:SAM-dependent methyltransferase
MPIVVTKESAVLRKDLHEENRQSWNEATIAHNSHKLDQARYLREGGSTLFPEETELLGDIRGKTLVHLQCNSGQDTLSLASLGASVTGVDICDTAIAFAHQLAQAASIPAVFERADVYDWFDKMAQRTQRFDVAFCSYGAICWLSDLRMWAKGVASVLQPGGSLVMVDFHPFAMVLEEDWSLKYPYFAEGRVLTWPEGIGDYVAEAGQALTPSGYLEGVPSFKNPFRSHEFQWGIGEIVIALLEAGLILTALREYPYSNGAKLFQGMRERPGHRMVPPENLPSLPLMYGIKAIKPV